MRSHILFAMLAVTLLLPIRELPASEEASEQRLAAHTAPMPLAVLAGWPPEVHAEVEFGPQRPPDLGRGSRLLRGLPPSEFIRGWVEEAGATHIQRENVTILAMPEYAVLLDQEVDWQVRSIGTRSEIFEDARNSLTRSFEDVYFRSFSTPLTMSMDYHSGMIVEDRTVYAWDDGIRSLEDFLFWILRRHPHMRLVVIIQDVEQIMGVDPHTGNAVQDDWSAEHRHVVDFGFRTSAYAAMTSFESLEFVTMANWDLFPAMEAEEVLETLAASGDPAMFERLVGTLTWGGQGPRGNRVWLESLSPEARRTASKANMLANIRIHDPILPPLSEISYDPGDPLDLLVMARIAAWKGDAQALAFSRAVLQHKQTLEGDWKRYFSETLRIYELRTEPEALPLSGTSLHRGGPVRPRR